MTRATPPTPPRGYLMESDEEATRLEVKTDGRTVEEHTRWAGLKPGQRAADLSCGSGKTTFHLNRPAQPGGRTPGVDIAAQRIEFARQNYQAEGLEFLVKDIREPFGESGTFDFIWVRFVLEYYRDQSFDLVRHIAGDVLRPGGSPCLIDLDCNCLRFQGFPARTERAVKCIMERLEADRNFDPYVGVQLYAYLYDVGFEDIRVMVAPHNSSMGPSRRTKNSIGARRLKSPEGFRDSISRNIPEAMRSSSPAWTSCFRIRGYLPTRRWWSAGGRKPAA